MSVGKTAEKRIWKDYMQNKKLKVKFSAFTYICFSFVSNFFCRHFYVFSNGFVFSLKFCFFCLPFWFFSKNRYFWGPICAFWKRWWKLRQLWIKIWKHAFCFKVFEFHFPPFPTPSNSIFSKMPKLLHPTEQIGTYQVTSTTI